MQARAVDDGVRGEGDGDGPGIEQPFIGNAHAAARSGAEAGIAGVDLVGRECPCAAVAVGDGVVDDRVEARQLIVVPGDEDGAGALDGPPELLRALLEESVAARDQA